MLEDRVVHDFPTVKLVCIPESSASDTIFTWLEARNVVLEVANVEYDIHIQSLGTKRERPNGRKR